MSCLETRNQRLVLTPLASITQLSDCLAGSGKRQVQHLAGRECCLCLWSRPQSRGSSEMGRSFLLWEQQNPEACIATTCRQLGRQGPGSGRPGRSHRAGHQRGQHHPRGAAAAAGGVRQGPQAVGAPLPSQRHPQRGGRRRRSQRSGCHGTLSPRKLTKHTQEAHAAQAGADR